MKPVRVAINKKEPLLGNVEGKIGKGVYEGVMYLASGRHPLGRWGLPTPDDYPEPSRTYK